MGILKKIYYIKFSTIANELFKLFPTFKNALLYFGGSIIQLIISVITSPIFARNLSAEEFGIVGYFTSVNQFIFPLSTLSLTFYYLFRYYKQDENENKKLFSHIILFLTISNFFMLTLSYGILYAYFYFKQIPIPFFPYSLILLFTLYLDVYKTFALMQYRLKKAAFKYFIITSLGVVITILTSLLFVVVFQWGAVGKMTGTLTSSLFIALFIVFTFKIKVRIHFDIKIIKEGLKWALPMIFSAYFYLPMANIDRILLAPLGETSELGFYSIGGNIAGYIGTAALALYSAFEPDFFKHVVNRNKKKFFINAFVYLGSLLLLTCAFFIFSKSIVDYLTSGRYTRAYIYANYFAVAFFIMSTAKITNSIILALGKSKGQLLINIIAGLIGFTIYKILVDNYRFIGASYGRISVSIVYLLTQIFYVLYLMSKRKFLIHPNKL